MNFIDLVVIGAIIVFALTGWRSGFVAGLLSFVGFIAGGIVGAYLAPYAIEAMDITGMSAFALGSVIVLGLAIVGQIILSVLGRLIRDKISWEPARIVDSLAGSMLNVVAVLAICWLLAATAAALPASTVAAEIRASRLLSTIDVIVPPPARDFVANLRTAVDGSGIPQLFDSFGVLPTLPVDPPSVAVVRDPDVQAALSSVVKVKGAAPQCGSGSSGSGFAFAPQRVITNAHVVAAVDELVVSVPNVGDLRAEVVYFDPRIDVAVLYVPDMNVRSLSITGPLDRGDSAVIAGYPGGGPMTATPARVRGTVPGDLARGTDIYGKPGVAREIYVLRGTARPGNSGGPLITPTGRVGGVIFAQAAGDPETAYALTGGQVEEAIRQGASATTPVSTGPCKRV